MKILSRHTLLTALLMIASFYAVAIPPAPGGHGGPPCFPGPCIPIDGGISFLLAAAAVYGGKKLYDNQRKK
ncbi:MAG: PID-CTERM protein-sorting domain-containing protein [Bacteroidia bacterium]